MLDVDDRNETQSLLQWTPQKAHNGQELTCRAEHDKFNRSTIESKLTLNIYYRPLCRKREIKLIGAALQEPSMVECEVDAFPPPDTFEWTLNNSAGSIKVDPERFTVNSKDGISILKYIPVSDVDYGTLACRATNLAGQQVAPCVYTLLPATHPDPPHNCTVYNLTDDSLDLICLIDIGDCPKPPEYSTVVANTEAKNSGSVHSLARTHSPTTPLSAQNTELQNDRNNTNGLRTHREVVTTRTPLLAAHQESCV
ncbi:unnamed protein product [Leptidea sinapis]|uniref:Ig-like domain-containing protein n=1 Tax=Leptidea sinapis TaxID=189913 RepID=A0A5E4QK22_9NEOP|nr:unnamed protein product [Leptidea sinapis]